MNRQDHNSSPRVSPATAFEAVIVAKLLALEERIARTGLRVDEVVSAVAVAELFPGILAAAYDAEGRYVWVSSSFSSVTGSAREAVLGRTLSELFDHAWSQERLTVIKEVLDSRQPIATVEIFHGLRLEGACFPAVSDSSEPMVFYVGRFGLSISHRGVNHRSAGIVPTRLLEVADWGPLSVLTRRELDVLRLNACGLDNTGIARRIHRTKRAVEWHIMKLYEHLNCTQRTELFRFGLLAGLPEFDDQHWERMVGQIPPDNQE